MTIVMIAPSSTTDRESLRLQFVRLISIEIDAPSDTKSDMTRFVQR